ncbi:MAG: T9SS type A sorting domain-containing protein [Tannerella sp.]|jgi:hypothetical protein|nr:T9SS type A sorting domain-containing protein [Tannerella sp.]
MKKNIYITAALACIVCLTGFSGQMSAQPRTVKAGSTILTETGDGTNVYEGIVSFSTDGTFRVEIDDAEYGFITYSGNGGVGTIAQNDGSVRGSGYYVDKSIGRLAAGTDGVHPLWIATGKGGDVRVKVDLSYEDNIPRYYLALVSGEPNVLLKESFDLFAWGSDWLSGTTRTPYRIFHATPSNVKAEDMDGTESPITTSTAATVTGTTTFDSSDGAALFIENRDLSGWTLTKICEMPGYIRLSSPDKGAVVTPALAGLSGTSDITVEFDVCRFAGGGDITFGVEGAGSITGATYMDIIEDNVSYGGSYPRNTDPVAIPGVSGTAFTINTEMAPAWSGVNNFVKWWTHFKVSVSSAGSDTRISMDGSAAASVNDARICLDNMLIKSVPVESGLDAVKQANISIYPNPVRAGEALYISLPGDKGQAAIRITDIAGRLILVQDNAKSPLAAPELPGMYVLQVLDPAGNLYTQKIMVE